MKYYLKATAYVLMALFGLTVFGFACMLSVLKFGSATALNIWFGLAFTAILIWMIRVLAKEMKNADEVKLNK